MPSPSEIGNCEMCGGNKQLYYAYNANMCSGCKNLGWQNKKYYKNLGIELDNRSIQRQIKEDLEYKKKCKTS